MRLRFTPPAPSGHPPHKCGGQGSVQNRNCPINYNCVPGNEPSGTQRCNDNTAGSSRIVCGDSPQITNLYIFSNSFGSYLYKYTNLRSPLDKYSFKYYYMYIFKYKLRRNTVLTLTVYCKSHKRRPIRFSTPMAFQDIQAQIPPAWCSVCGSEVFERGQDRCVRCRKARGANR